MSYPVMVERVARAIRKRSYGTERGWAYEIHEAEAALEAMREPTDAMIKAGVQFALGVSLSSGYHWPDYIADMHRLQIDAALTPVTPQP